MKLLLILFVWHSGGARPSEAYWPGEDCYKTAALLRAAGSQVECRWATLASPIKAEVPLAPARSPIPHQDPRLK